MGRAPIDDQKYLALGPDLKSASFYLRRQAEYPHIFHVLSVCNEFLKRIVFCVSHEKFGKRLAQRVGDDEFRWWDAGTNGSQPGPERSPNAVSRSDGEILEQSLGDNAGLDEGMIGANFAFDVVAVLRRLPMKVRPLRKWDQAQGRLRGSPPEITSKSSGRRLL